ncbi:MAG: acetoacetate decarboxylase family protein [Proteobacteria bacterium]|nr:acetoacetate decarboxylase family protein [Pseudomonadota bacterium]MCP4915946.1 acetoacetate decarboxylase family protein [Pseudomonadota bacterium]
MIREHLTPRPHRGLRVGEELTLASGELAVVMTGHLSATVGGFFDRLLVPNDLVGVEQGPVTTLTALTEAELLIMDFGEVLAGTESVAALKAMLALAEAQVRDLTDRRAELERNLDDFLDADDGGFAAPPYVATKARLVMVVLEDRSLASELPRPLRPIPGFEDRVLLVWAHYPDFRPPDGPDAAYEETSVFVPCIDPGAGGPGLYSPALFPESMMAIITEREGFKFPKRFASVTLDERLAHMDAGDMRALVTWDEAVPRSDAAWVEDLAAAMLGDGPGTRIGSFLGAVWGRSGLRPAIKTHAPLPIYVRNRVGAELVVQALSSAVLEPLSSGSTARTDAAISERRIRMEWGFSRHWSGRPTGCGPGRTTPVACGWTCSWWTWIGPSGCPTTCCAFPGWAAARSS